LGIKYVIYEGRSPTSHPSHPKDFAISTQHVMLGLSGFIQSMTIVFYDIEVTFSPALVREV
jgi:hypothetical protein